MTPPVEVEVQFAMHFHPASSVNFQPPPRQATLLVRYRRRRNRHFRSEARNDDHPGPRTWDVPGRAQYPLPVPPCRPDAESKTPGESRFNCPPANGPSGLNEAGVSTNPKSDARYPSRFSRRSGPCRFDHPTRAHSLRWDAARNCARRWRRESRLPFAVRRIPNLNQRSVVGRGKATPVGGEGNRRRSDESFDREDASVRQAVVVSHSIRAMPPGQLRG